MRKHYDVAIIGSGQAAPALAHALASKGEMVALIEGHLLGGSCVNAGCTPTKTLRKSARVAHMARRAADFGVQTGPVTVDFGAAMLRMRDRVDTARSGLENWVGGNENIDVIREWGQFVGKDDGNFVVGVGKEEITATRVYINTGTRAFIPDIDGLSDVPHLDNVGLLALTKLPKHLIVVGGSYIGLEMGQIFCRLGSEVTIIHQGIRVADREDQDISAAIETFMCDEGVNIQLGQGITRAEQTDTGVALVLADETRIEGSHLLFATGRTPNSDKLNLSTVGVDISEYGYIPTDNKLRTNVPGIWALGDINRRGAFTHTSYHDHEIVLAELGHLDTPNFQWQDADQRRMTYAMFSDPPLGRVGISLADAQKAAKTGINILVATRQMADIGRAKEEGETTGLIRLIVDADTEKFLGAAVLGIAGDEIIAIISNYMATGASYKIMQQALPVHPTVAELLPTILGALEPLEL